MKSNSTVLRMPISAGVPKLTMPVVVGMGLKDAVYMLENKGLKVLASGRGRVINQSLAAGTAFKKGQTVTLLLN